jgi:hypothetical protein
MTRIAKAARIIGAVLPRLDAYGLPVGYDALRWVSVPWSVTLRTRAPTRWLEVRAGRLMLAAEWSEGTELIVKYLRTGDWTDCFLTDLGNTE